MRKTSSVKIAILIISMIMISGHFSCLSSKKIQTAGTGNLKPIKLMEPQTAIGKPLMQTLKERRSERSLIKKKLPDQVLSNLMWAAFGINRPDSGKRTAPSAGNWQEIDIYVAMEEGLFVYDAKTHSLIPVLAQNITEDVMPAMQPLRFSVIDAPINLIYVSDDSKRNVFAAFTDKEEEKEYAAMHAGFIAQNVNLFCASEGLGTVVRGMLDKESMRKIMALRPDQRIILAQTVGYPNLSD